MPMIEREDGVDRRRRYGFIALLGLLLTSASADKGPRLLGIEHMPLGVADLDTAQRRFRALGFTLKPGRHHDNGIRNALAKFGDGTYLELITAPAAVDTLTAQYRRHLAGGDGPAFLSLYVSSTAGLQARLASLGPRAEGGAVDFPEGPLQSYFFGTRERSPSDRPAYFIHANGAQSLDRVWLAPDNPGRVEQMLTLLGAEIRSGTACLVQCAPARIAKLRFGEIILLPKTAQRVAGRDIIGASISVASLARARLALRRGGIAIGPGGAQQRGRRLLVPPTLANGMWLDFHMRVEPDR